MSNSYTTIRVTNEVAQKLRRIRDSRGDATTLSDVINQCISHIDGVVENDTENVYREQVAYDLQYHDAHSSRSKYISFRDCANSQLGDVFSANTNISAEEYANEYAEVIFKDADSVVFRVSQEICENNKKTVFNNIVHISLF